MNSGGRRKRVLLWVAIVAVCLVAASLFAYAYYSGGLSVPGGGSQGVTFVVSNITSTLNGMFNPGSIQGLGSNSTAVLALGASYYSKSTDYNLPELADLFIRSGVLQASNMTGEIASYFNDGAMFGAAWNGSSWLLTGAAIWGSMHTGELVTLKGSSVTNITDMVSGYFNGGGIWVDAWNGTGWLVGGNSSQGSVLLFIQGNRVTDLSGFLPNNKAGDWIQLLAWNGTGWFIGGKGTAGTLMGGTYTDILQQSVFRDSGVFAAAWNGNSWLFGGGPPAAIEEYSNGNVLPQAKLPASFNSWVNSILTAGSGWLIGGKGVQNGSVFIPELAYLPYSTPAGGNVTDLSGKLPSSFNGGQVQSMLSPQLGGSTFYILAGQGNYNNTTGKGTGALASVTISSGTAVSYSSMEQIWLTCAVSDGDS